MVFSHVFLLNDLLYSTVVIYGQSQIFSNTEKVLPEQKRKVGFKSSLSLKKRDKILIK